MGAVKLDGLVKRLLSGGFSALAVKIASAGLSYLMLVVIARAMPASEYGRFAFGFSLATTLSLVFSFGLPVAVLRFWPEYRVKKQGAMARGFGARSFAFVGVGSVVCAMLFVLASVAAMSGRPGYGYAYFGSIAGLVVLMAVSEFVASALRADGLIVRALGPRDVLWRAIVIAGCSIVATRAAGFDAQSALLLAAVCLAGVFVPQSIYAARRLGIARADFFGETRSTEWRAAAWPMWGAAILFGLVQQFDVVLLGFFLSPEETGPYFAAFRTASLMSLLLIAGNMVAAPLIAQYYHSDDDEGLVRMCRVLIVCIALPTLAGFGILITIGRWLLTLFDPAFADAYYLLVILSAGFTVTALAGPVAYFLQMVGKEKEYLLIMALAYAAVVVVQCSLVPIFGAVGAAVPNAVGAVAGAFWSVSLLRRKVGFDPSIIGLVWPAERPGKSGATV